MMYSNDALHNIIGLVFISIGLVLINLMPESVDDGLIVFEEEEDAFHTLF